MKLSLYVRYGELKDIGVTVSVLCPGPVKTNWAKNAGKKYGVYRRKMAKQSRAGEGSIKMLIDFNQKEDVTLSGMNGGTGTMTAKMYMDEQGKIIQCSIHPGGSIGLHKHETSDDINYVLSGKGKAVCDGQEEILSAGTCHICRKGSEHIIVNMGVEDLILITVVVER